MYRTNQMEQFSRAYVQAVAAVAGMNVLHWAVDDDSIDTGFGTSVGRRARLEAQIKCTHVHAPTDDGIAFALKRKNYDDLRADAIVPRILVVLCVPEAPQDWMSQTADQLVIRRCAWWVGLAGRPETDNETSVTVHLPLVDIFSPAALQSMIQRVDEGRLP